MMAVRHALALPLIVAFLVLLVITLSLVVAASLIARRDFLGVIIDGLREARHE
jgi:hypothetical protein